MSGEGLIAEQRNQRVTRQHLGTKQRERDLRAGNVGNDQVVGVEPSGEANAQR